MAKLSGEGAGSPPLGVDAGEGVVIEGAPVREALPPVGDGEVGVGIGETPLLLLLWVDSPE